MEMELLDRVKKALELCRYDPNPEDDDQPCKMVVSCEICPYWSDERGCQQTDLFNDALLLLNAKEVKPVRSGRNLTWYYCCGACGQPIDPGDPYCRKCGKKVKWDE